MVWVSDTAQDSTTECCAREPPVHLEKWPCIVDATMSKAVDVTDAASEDLSEGAHPEGLLWTSKTCLSAIDGAVVGNTLGFVVGAFPGMCLGAASGCVVGVLGGGLVVPVLKPAVQRASEAFPGKFVIYANGAANSMISGLCVGPRVGDGKGNEAEDSGEQYTEIGTAAPSDEASCDRLEDPASRAQDASESQPPKKPSLQLFVLPARDLSATKDALDAAMVRASAAGVQGAVAGAEVVGAIVGTALAIPGAVLGSLVGGVVGMYVDVRDRYFTRQGTTAAASGSDVAAPTKDAADPAPPEFRGPAA
mmetsp:Transcript_81908/g.255801  ORF Transcript_81908/g.255801 Transcript_81908/m.255801 type:complete len:307 (+) Transcript_81908:2-922(+)